MYFNPMFIFFYYSYLEITDLKNCSNGFWKVLILNMRKGYNHQHEGYYKWLTCKET